jgi:hypothetical protein
MSAINETIKLLPPELRREVADFVEFLAQKHLRRKSKISHSKEKILKLAGAWKDMNESDFQSFINDIYERREKSFTRRLTFEKSIN